MKKVENLSSFAWPQEWAKTDVEWSQNDPRDPIYSGLGRGVSTVRIGRTMPALNRRNVAGIGEAPGFTGCRHVPLMVKGGAPAALGVLHAATLAQPARATHPRGQLARPRT